MVELARRSSAGRGMTTNLGALPGEPPSKLAMIDTDAISANYETTSSPATRAESAMKTNVTEQPPGTEMPFDFQAFLDQMKSKSAEPVARYLRRSVRARQGYSPDRPPIFP